MSKLNWQRGRFAGMPTEEVRPTKKVGAGCWSHVKREPVRVYTPEEREAFEALRRKRQGP